MQKHWQHPLYFTKKEKRGVIGMLLLTLCTCFFPILYGWIFPGPAPVLQDITAEIATLEIEGSDSMTGHPDNNVSEYPQQRNFKRRQYFTESQPAQLFPFDPNIISEEGWRKLGIKDKTIQTILKYRAKGGKFRSPQDIRKIWGISPDLAHQLIPYISIRQEPSKADESISYKKIERVINPIDINLADSADFASLPGIGERLSARIVLFRNRLGGFYSVEQIKEVYGLQDSIFQKIKTYIFLKTTVTRPVNINTADKATLQSHPYIRYQLADALIRYRAQHGRFNSIEDVKKIMLVNEDLYNKVAPYLVVE